MLQKYGHSCAVEEFRRNQVLVGFSSEGGYVLNFLSWDNGNLIVGGVKLSEHVSIALFFPPHKKEKLTFTSVGPQKHKSIPSPPFVPKNNFFVTC